MPESKIIYHEDLDANMRENLVRRIGGVSGLLDLALLGVVREINLLREPRDTNAYDLLRNALTQEIVRRVTSDPEWKNVYATYENGEWLPDEQRYAAWNNFIKKVEESGNPVLAALLGLARIEWNSDNENKRDQATQLAQGLLGILDDKKES